ncbi:MAG: patatin-like phospholipase family protein [Actinobacteria bacterium]|nr:patatin-like phospholipase family protein [Actinomycetota bacterium]
MAHRGHSGGRSERPSVTGAATLEEAHDLSMVYGGGGVFGIGYCVGVAHGLAAGGVPVAAAPALGTSAGSWAASAVALGVAYDDVARIEAPAVPNRSTGVLARIAREIFGESRHPLVSVSAVCVRTRRRHILDGGRYVLADLVAASSAVPGLLPPHRVDGRLYVDGGMWSATSIDAAADAHEVIVVAPLAGPHMGPIGRGAGMLLERELRSWRRRHPERRITMIRPSRAIASLAGRNPMNLFDADRARAVYPIAYDQGARCAEALLEHPTVRA